MIVFSVNYNFKKLSNLSFKISRYCSSGFWGVRSKGLACRANEFKWLIQSRSRQKPRRNRNYKYRIKSNRNPAQYGQLRWIIRYDLKSNVIFNKIKIVQSNEPLVRPNPLLQDTLFVITGIKFIKQWVYHCYWQRQCSVYFFK